MKITKELYKTSTNTQWFWRRLLRVPWTAWRWNQSILKEINPEHSLEGLMLKPMLQYFGHLIEELTHWKRPWCWERLKAGEGDNRKRWLDGITGSMDMNINKLSEIVKEREAWHVKVHWVTKSRIWLNDWTTANTHFFSFLPLTNIKRKHVNQGYC